MMSYFEITSISEKQLKRYLQDLVAPINSLQGNGFGKKITLADLDTGALETKTWEKIMTRVYGACTNKSNQKICKDLEEVRIQALNIRD